MPEARSLPELLAEADLVRKICRQMCAYDGVDPDEVFSEVGSQKFRAWETHVADVNAVLRALKGIAS